MTRIAIAFASLLLVSSTWADNLIYIDQIGTSATITIDQDGSGNRVGASGDDSKSDGASTTLDIDHQHKCWHNSQRC